MARAAVLLCPAECAFFAGKSECVRLCVCWLSTVVSFFCVRALGGVSTHWAFPTRLPYGRDSGTCLDLTQWTHHYPVRCALRDGIPSHLLSPCSTTTKLRQTTGDVSPGCLASRADCFSLSLCQPDHFGPDEHTRRPRHPKISARALLSTSCNIARAQHLVSSRLDSHLESRLILRIKPPLLARTSPSLFLNGTAILAGQDQTSWMMKQEGLGPQPLFFGTRQSPKETLMATRNRTPTPRTDNCERGHLGHFHTSPSPSGGPNLTRSKKTSSGRHPGHPTSVTTPFELKSATTRWAPARNSPLHSLRKATLLGSSGASTNPIIKPKLHLSANRSEHSLGMLTDGCRRTSQLADGP